MHNTVNVFAFILNTVTQFNTCNIKEKLISVLLHIFKTLSYKTPENKIKAELLSLISREVCLKLIAIKYCMSYLSTMKLSVQNWL